MKTENYLVERRTRIDRILAHYLPDPASEPTCLYQAMHYAALNGGKRLRPLLVYAAGETLGATLEQLDRAACSVELIHAYSLIHDDLPALDNDDFRRGRPSCHKAFDEATAILAGDALQALAFEILTKEISDSTQCLAMITALTKACGDMVSGQALELTIPPEKINITTLETIQHLKTGALMRVSVQLGALTARATPTQLQILDQYAECLGLAYQIQDDIEDSDAATPQQNYVACLGLAAAQARVQELRQQAFSTIEVFGAQAAPLRYLVNDMLR